MQNRLTLLFTVIAVVLGYAVFQAIKLDNKFAEGTQNLTGTVLTELPDAYVTELGKTTQVNLKSLTEGKYALAVHFWATWCGPCAKEFPSLMKLVEKMKDNKNLKFVFIAVQDEKKAMMKFLKKNNVFGHKNVLLYEDKTDVHRKLSTYKLPETIIFDSSNKVIRKFSGPQEWESDYIFNELKSLK